MRISDDVIYRNDNDAGFIHRARDRLHNELDETFPIMGTNYGEIAVQTKFLLPAGICEGRVCTATQFRIRYGGAVPSLLC